MQAHDERFTAAHDASIADFSYQVNRKFARRRPVRCSVDGCRARPAIRHWDTRQDYIEHIRTEHSTFRWLLEPMLTAVGLEIVATDFRGSVYGPYTCVKP